MYGDDLVTQDDAVRALHRLVTEQAQGIADTLSWNLSRVLGCEVGSDHIIYRMTGPSQQPLSGKLVYAPTDIIMDIAYEMPKKVTPNDPILSLLDFQPA